MLGIEQDPQLVAVLAGSQALRVELPDQTTVVQVAPAALFVQLEQREVIAVADLGLVGAQGPPGAGSDANFLFTQGTPSATWVIVHPLGKYPSVTVIDSNGRYVLAPVRYDSLTQVTLLFHAAFSGLATLN